jgi:hypothetical protein
MEPHVLKQSDRVDPIILEFARSFVKTHGPIRDYELICHVLDFVKKSGKEMPPHYFLARIEDNIEIFTTTDISGDTFYYKEKTHG